MARARRAFAVLTAAAIVAVACSSFDEGGSTAVDGGGTSADANVPAADGSSPTDGAASDVAASSPYAEAVLADEPLAYWRMGKVNGNVVPDESGHANDLTLTGAGHFTVGVPGAIAGDTAVAFDGIGGAGVAAKPGELDFAGDASFTIECWAKASIIDGGDYFQYLVSHVQGSDPAKTENGFILYLRGFIPDATEPLRAAAEYSRPDAGATGLLATHPGPAEWTHYALVVDATKVTLFLNGVAAAFGDRRGQLEPSPGVDFVVATSAREVGKRWFSGAMDEIAVYPSALSSARIAAHHALRQ